ncbi:MAG: hypothetical protein ACEQSA_04580 [Weeksellaceae bacterium]
MSKLGCLILFLVAAVVAAIVAAFAGGFRVAVNLDAIIPTTQAFALPALGNVEMSPIVLDLKNWAYVLAPFLPMYVILCLGHEYIFNYKKNLPNDPILQFGWKGVMKDISLEVFFLSVVRVAYILMIGVGIDSVLAVFFAGILFFALPPWD